VRPGTEAFTLTTILPALAALCYAAFHILTRNRRIRSRNPGRPP